MKALYRKYRPTKLAEVVGQEQVTEPLTNALKANKISHAYLFIGPRGTGKTSVARILAHEVNGFSYSLEDDYVDIIEIDGASNRGIDDIRELREKAMIAPTTGKYKIYIIDEVHMLTKEAFNALLKTLEEPPAHIIFIMATTDAHKVPVTITSRAQVYNFRLAEPATMLEHLKKITRAEGIKISDGALKMIVRRGGGSYRDSLSLLDQISTLSEGEITEELVRGAMGLPEDEKITALLNAYVAHDNAKITDELKMLLAGGIKPEIITEQLITAIIAEPRTELLTLLAKLPEVKAPFAEARLLVALLMDGSGAPTAASTPSLSTARISPAATTTSAPPTNSAATVAVSSMTSPAAANIAPAGESFAPIMAAAGDFTLESFFTNVQALNDAIYAQVLKATCKLNGDTLDIYPDKKIAKTILTREGNKRILMEAAPGVRINIHDAGENPEVKNDALLSKISGIMGGEVRNDTGGNPFE